MELTFYDSNIILVPKSNQEKKKRDIKLKFNIIIESLKAYLK